MARELYLTRLRPSLLATGLAGLALLGLPRVALACSCAGPLSPAFEALWSAAVFEGRVDRIQPVGAGSGGGLGTLEVDLTVTRAWKGVHSRNITVLTAASGAACGFHFVVGQQYVVYASGNRIGLPQFLGTLQYARSVSDGVAAISETLASYRDPPQLSTHLCSRTVESSGAAEDLAYLGPGSPPVTAPSLQQVLAVGIILALGLLVLARRRRAEV